MTLMAKDGLAGFSKFYEMIVTETCRFIPAVCTHHRFQPSGDKVFFSFMNAVVIQLRF